MKKSTSSGPRQKKKTVSASSTEKSKPISWHKCPLHDEIYVVENDLIRCPSCLIKIVPPRERGVRLDELGLLIPVPKKDLATDRIVEYLSRIHW